METKDNAGSRSNTIKKLAKRIKRKYPILYSEVGTKGVKQILKKVIVTDKDDNTED